MVIGNCDGWDKGNEWEARLWVEQAFQACIAMEGRDGLSAPEGLSWLPRKYLSG
jgi:hypothetical protein